MNLYDLLLRGQAESRRMIHRTLVNLKRARIVIPQLSPTLTKARVSKWFKDPKLRDQSIECYEPLFVLECSPDLVSSGYRVHENHHPLMLIEAHDEGILNIHHDLLFEHNEEDADQWYPVGHVLGEIDDEDDEDTETSDWLWQAYSYTEETETGDDTNTTTSSASRQSNYAVLGVVELKGILRARGMDVSGNHKDELLSRLQEHDEK